MMLKTGAAVVLVLGISMTAISAQPSFQDLGDVPGGTYVSIPAEMSSDGSVVVGESTDETGQVAFYWTPDDGMLNLGRGLARSVSADGEVVVGTQSNPNGAFRWTASTGKELLSPLTGSSDDCLPWGVSGNGQVVVGESTSPNGGHEAVMWLAPDQPVPLGELPGVPVSTFQSEAYAASLDGSVIVGQAGGQGSPREAFRWTQETGMVGLGAGWNGTSAESVSADGFVIVGWGELTPYQGEEAFRWTEADGLVGLGDLPGGAYGSRAYGVSADGSVIVGYSHSYSGQTAFIWDEINGMRDLNDVLVNECGLDLSGWHLTHAWDVSADGLTIVGDGNGPNSGAEAWIATVPEPATLGLLALGGLALLRRRPRVVQLAVTSS